MSDNVLCSSYFNAKLKIITVLCVLKIFNYTARAGVLQLWQRNFNQKLRQALQKPLKSPNFASRKIGKMAEWSIATVLKTVEGHTSGGSNPSLSAKKSSRKVALLALEREWMRTLGFVTAKRSALQRICNIAVWQIVVI